MFKQIHHVVIATKSLVESVQLYEEKFNLQTSPFYVNPSREAREVLLDLGNASVVLSEPVDDQGPVGRFVSERGEGLYLLAVEVEDLPLAVEMLQQRGVRVSLKEHDGQTEVFLEPQSARGALIQLIERFRSLFARLPDGRLHYLKVGSGPPLFLLHSLGTNARFWKDVFPFLSGHFTIYALDMLGHGESDKPSSDYTIVDHARVVIKLMDLQRLSQVHLVGNSVGAQIGAEVAAAYPKRVERLALVGLPSWSSEEERRELLERALDQLDDRGLPRPRTLEELTPMFTHPSPILLDRLNASRARAGEWVKKTLQQVWTYDAASRLGDIRCPTILLFGDQDPLTKQLSFLEQHLPSARSSVLAESGHMPQVDTPQAVAKTLLTFFQ